MEGGRLPCSQHYVSSVPSAIPHPILHSWLLIGENSLLPHQTGVRWARRRLINCVYLGSTRQTDSLHYRAAGDFLKVNLINTEQCHITGWGREVAGGCEGGVVGASRVLSDVIWSVIVALPLEASSTYLEYSTMSKTGSQCFGVYQQLAGL